MRIKFAFDFYLANYECGFFLFDFSLFDFLRWIDARAMVCV